MCSEPNDGTRRSNFGRRRVGRRPPPSAGAATRNYCNSSGAATYSAATTLFPALRGVRRPVRLPTTKYDFHCVGLEQGPNSYIYRPLAPRASSDQSDVFIEKSDLFGLSVDIRLSQQRRLRPVESARARNVQGVATGAGAPRPGGEAQSYAKVPARVIERHGTHGHFSDRIFPRASWWFQIAPTISLVICIACVGQSTPSRPGRKFGSTGALLLALVPVL
jgi:hypothetical protein